MKYISVKRFLREIAASGCLWSEDRLGMERAAVPFVKAPAKKFLKLHCG
jgi:hypothetical protein